MKNNQIRGVMMAVGSLLAGFASAEVRISESNTKQDAEDMAKACTAKAEAGVFEVWKASMICRMYHGEWPTNLVQLVVGEYPFLEGGEAALYDPWMNKYELEVKEKNIIVKSAGGDGVMGTSDDILSGDIIDKCIEAEKRAWQLKMQVQSQTNSAEAAKANLPR